MNVTEFALIQIRGKKEAAGSLRCDPDTSPSSHTSLQPGPASQSDHVYNGVTIALLFPNIHVAWAVWGLRCATLTWTSTPRCRSW